MCRVADLCHCARVLGSSALFGTCPLSFPEPPFLFAFKKSNTEDELAQKQLSVSAVGSQGILWCLENWRSGRLRLPVYLLLETLLI